MTDATPRTRHFCPLGDWHLDAPNPDPFPTIAPDWLASARAEHPQYADDPVFLALLAHNEPIEAEIRAHLETHTLLEWVTEVMRLRAERPTMWPREQRIPLVAAGQTHPGGYAPQWWQAVEEYHRSKGVSAPAWYEHAMTAAGINEALEWWNERADGLLRGADG